MSRQCQCGGLIAVGQLTGDRESWRCKACGRYEIVGAPLADNPAVMEYVMPLELLTTNDQGEVVVDVALNQYTGAIESACLPLHPDRPAWKLEVDQKGWRIAHSTILEMMETMDAEQLAAMLH